MSGSIKQVEDDKTPILLIYYNFKGIGQMIRYLLTYLEIHYVDIFLEQYQQQKQSLSPNILQMLKSKVINKHSLPAIIHNDQVIYDLNQITNYICITFARQQLLGIDMYQKALICQIQQIYSLKLIKVIQFFKQFVANVNKITQSQLIFPYIEQRFYYLFRQSGYFKQLSTYLLRQQNPQFVLSNITIADFYFIESSRVAVAFFGCFDQELASGHWKKDAQSYRLHKKQKGEQIQHIDNLRAMNKYIEFFSSQPFYLKNQKYLESFDHSPLVITKEQYKGMKKLFASHSMDLYYQKNDENI